MTTQQFLKGLLMAIVGVVVAFFSTTPIDFPLLIVTTVCAILTYAGKNLIPWLHSDSEPGALSFINLVSSLLVALGSGILSYAGQFLINGVVEWSILLKVVLSVTFTYLGGTWFAPAHNDVSNRRLFEGKIPGPSKAIIFLLLLLPMSASGQDLFRGVLKMSRQNPAIINMVDHNKAIRDHREVGDFIDHQWLIRPAMGISGFETQLKVDPVTGEFPKKAFEEVALGLGFQKYKDIGGTPVNTIGGNLLFFFRSANISKLQLKTAATFHFWSLADIGVGRDWSNEYWFLLTGLSYSF